MLINTKNLSLLRIINVLFCLFPISFILGSLIVTTNIYLFLILCIFYINKKKYKFNLDHTNITLICFFLIIIISSLINIESIKYGFALKSILLFRFALLYLIVETLLLNNDLNLKKFFITSLLCTSFVSFDLIFQYIFGYNLFGQVNTNIELTGITGVFGDESIVGGYIRKFLLFSIFGFLFLFEKNHKKNLLLFILVLLHSTAVFVANNKISMVILFCSLILLLLMNKQTRLVIATSLIAFVAVAAILLNSDDQLKKRYQYFYERFLTESVEVSVDLEAQNKLENKKTTTTKKIYIYNSHHVGIFFAAVESWKDSPILGWGHKSFRTKCYDVLQNIVKFNLRCATHPHNYHLEILHDYGLVGFILISTFVFMTLFKTLKRLKNRKLHNKVYFMYFIPVVIIVLAEVWPIKSSGSLFTTWNGTFVWLTIALSAIVKKDFIKKNLNFPIKNRGVLVLSFSTVLVASLLIKRLYLI